MALEIERKFLVIKDRLPQLGTGKKIIQGYLSENPSIRFRVLEGEVIITVKDYYSGGRRFELETSKKDPTEEEINKLKSLAVVPPVIKTRYRISYCNLVWELDIYEEKNKGLITVDVELPEENYPLTFPDWVDDKKEITGISKYSNVNLGRNPISHWVT